MAGEERVVWGCRAHQLVPIDTLHQLPVGAVLGHCQGLAAHLLPAGHTSAHPCPPLPTPPGQGPRTLGSRVPSKCADRQNPGLESVSPEPTFNVPGTRGQHLWAEMQEERCLVLDPWPWTKLYVC